MNLLILGNLNSINEIDYNSAVQFLNVFVFSELCKPALLFRETGTDLIFITYQTGNSFFGFLNVLVELSLKNKVFLTSNHFCLEVLVHMSFHLLVVFDNFFLSGNF